MLRYTYLIILLFFILFKTGLLGFLSQLVNSETRGLGKLASRIDFNGYYSNTSNKNEYKQIIIYL